jgi:hypothetical protein
MDFQLICILLIFLTLFILEQYEKNEGFTQQYKSPLKQESYKLNNRSIDLKGNNGNSYTTIGEYPAIPLCNSCNLEENKIGPPYLQRNQLGDTSSSIYQTVSTTCNNIFGKNYNNLNKPFLVAGRSAGRTRQCRRLM